MSPSDSPFTNLQGSFGQKTAPATGVNYTHAQEDKLRTMLEAALSQSPTGKRLLDLAAQQRIVVRIIKGKENSGFIPESRAIYISVPPELSTPSNETILDLGAFLRQAELHFLGHKNPDISMTSHDYTVVFDSKIIDSIAVMCKISTELKEIGKPEFVDALARMGHGSLYEVYSKSGQGKELVEAYYKLIEKRIKT